MVTNTRRNPGNDQDGENGRDRNNDGRVGNAPDLAAGMATMFQTFMTQMMQQLVNTGAGPNPGRNEMPPQGPNYLVYMDKMVKYKTQHFTGGVEPMEADEWRIRLERNFESLHVPVGYQKDLAVFFLEGDAFDWWKGVERKDPTKVHDYESFKEEFITKYFPRETRDRLATEFLELRQGSQTVRDYETKFNRLKKYVGRDAEGEQDQISRFLRGIKPEIRTIIAVRDYDTLGQLVEKAASVESNLEEEARASRSRRNQDRGKAKVADRFEDQVNEENVRKMCDTCGRVHLGVCRLATGACFECGGLDHILRDCPNRRARPRDGRAVECFKCGAAGHFARDCTAPANREGQIRGERRGEVLPPPPKRARVNMIEVAEEDANQNPRED